MNVAHAVIGANFGDEGKGLMTDYLASKFGGECLVVRFNGGAQAGHTVVTPAGQRHVFSHFGSGTFLGVETYLSQFFVANPMLFVRELQELHSKSEALPPSVLMDRLAFVTTPFDVFINQLLESRRAGTRHGSCGAGINETVTRCLRSPELCTRAKDLLDPAGLRERLFHIGRCWLPSRLQEHGVAREDPSVVAFLELQESIIQRYLADVKVMMEHATVLFHYPDRYPHVVFEGAQGLLLDEDRLDLWPHLTRSKTGLTNVVFLSTRLGCERIDAIYVSRTYLTRHGAGPLPGESDWSFPDHTNILNPFQGKLRFAALDWKRLEQTIRQDVLQSRRAFSRIDVSLAMTCVDQLPLDPWSLRGSLPIKYLSSGPSRGDIESMHKPASSSVGIDLSVA